MCVYNAVFGGYHPVHFRMVENLVAVYPPMHHDSGKHEVYGHLFRSIYGLKGGESADSFEKWCVYGCTGNLH